MCPQRPVSQPQGGLYGPAGHTRGESQTFKHTIEHGHHHTSWLVECWFTSTETVSLLGTGTQDGHLDFHIAPELSQ